jgi:Fe-S-cluster containining protein
MQSPDHELRENMGSSKHYPVPDGAIRRVIKFFARAQYFLVALGWRGIVSLRSGARYSLAGQCESCALCCEEVSIDVNAVVFHTAPLRLAIVAWHRIVNRFRYVRRHNEGAVIVFSCDHFNHTTRRCDSYSSRPGICRDYPRNLLDRAWPQMLDDCAYRAVSRNAGPMASAIDSADLSPDKRAELKRKLHVIE